MRMIDLDAHLLETRRRTKKGAAVQALKSAKLCSIKKGWNALEASIKIKDRVMTEEIVANKENKRQEPDGSKSQDPCSRDVTVTNCPLHSPQAWHWECRLRIFDSSPAAWGWPLDPRGPLSPAAQDGERCPFGGRRGRVGTVGPENKSLKITFFLSH